MESALLLSCLQNWLTCNIEDNLNSSVLPRWEEKVAFSSTVANECSFLGYAASANSDEVQLI